MDTTNTDTESVTRTSLSDMNKQTSRNRSTNKDESSADPPVLPNVCFKPQPHFEVLDEVMKPTRLVASCRFPTTVRSSVSFMFTIKQIQNITESRDSDVNSESTVRVHLRFCLLNTQCPQGDAFPPQLVVLVNGSSRGLRIGSSKRGEAVDITPLCRLSSTDPNLMSIVWKAGTTQAYCSGVYLVRKVSSDILLQRLKDIGNRHTDQTVGLIKKTLPHDLDDSVAATSLKVSLICPISKTRIQTPCRSITCDHLQCFDATTYFMMNEKKPRWVCPLCDEPAPLDKLLIDGYFEKISRDAPGASQIEIHGDGSWHVTTHNQDVNAMDVSSTGEGGSKFPTAPEVHVITDSPVPSSVPSLPTVQPTCCPVIDLTGDNSGDEHVLGRSKKRTNEDVRTVIQSNKRQRRDHDNERTVTVTNPKTKQNKKSSTRKNHLMRTNQFHNPHSNQSHNPHNNQFYNPHNNQFYNPHSNQFQHPDSFQFQHPHSFQFQHPDNNWFIQRPFHKPFQNNWFSNWQ